MEITGTQLIINSLIEEGVDKIFAYPGGYDVEVIKVIDLTTMETHTKELLFIKVKNCSPEDKQNIFQMAQVFEMDIVDIGRKSVLLQCVHTEKRVDRLIEIFAKQYPNNIIVVRGGAVAIGAINVTER